jgi:hypothetical protein
MGAVKDSLLLATLLLSVVLSVQAKFIVEHGSLKITNPEEAKGDYDIALANFGLPMYGANLRCVSYSCVSRSLRVVSRMGAVLLHRVAVLILTNRTTSNLYRCAMRNSFALS